MSTPPTPPVIVRAKLAWLGEIAHLETATFPEGDAFPRRNLRHQLQSPQADFLVFRRHRQLGGYGTVLYRRGSVQARLYNLVVAPCFRGNGDAKALMAALMAAARRRHCTEMVLEVRQDNHPAIAFYRKFGFAEFAQIPGYYHDGTTALRMRLPLA